MSLRKLSDEDLLTQTTTLVSQERRVTLEILHHLREVERRRLFAARGFSSLFEYCTQELSYSEASAQRRISSMRLLRELPEFESQIKSGTLTLSVVAQAQSFFKREEIKSPAEKREILRELENKSTRQAERELVSRSTTPEKLIPEKVRPISDSHSEVRFVVPEELLEKIRELQNLLAHSQGEMTIAQVMEYSVRLALEKKRIKAPAKSLPAPKVYKRIVPASLKRQIWQRDRGRCTYQDPKSGRRCQSSHALEVDHVHPFAKGGQTVPENLRLLCRAHNQFAALTHFGVVKMGQHIKGIG